MMNFKRLVFFSSILILVANPVNLALAEELWVSYDCPQFIENGAIEWTEADKASAVMALAIGGDGTLKGRTNNHLPVFGDFEIETVNDSAKEATLMQDYKQAAAPASFSNNQEFNYVTEIEKRLNSENTHDEDYKSAQKLLQALAITTEPGESEDHPFVNQFLNLYASSFVPIPQIACPIEGELQFEAFDNFGVRHSTTYNLTGVTVGGLLFVEGKSSSQQTWGDLTVMMKEQNDANYEGIWNLTGNSEISLPNTNGVASIQIADIKYN